MAGTGQMYEGFTDHFYSATDGLRLHARLYGERREGSLPVVCLPGLTRNARDFHRLALHLANRHENPRHVIAFDYRGRGQSEHDKDWQNYTVPTEAADIIAGLVSLDVEHGAFIGTSRGGLIIHVLAGMRPGLLKAIVFNDIGPEIGGAGIVAIRSYLSRAPRPKTIEEAVGIQKSVHGAAFPALTDGQWREFVEAIYRIDDKGRPVPDYDPDLVKTLTSADLDSPLPTLWPQFDGLRGIPMMGLRGENSQLLTPETFAEMQRRHEGFEAVTIPGQGHAPHLDTDGLPERIARFIDKASAGARSGH